MAKSPGSSAQTLGHYVLQKKLGAGAMGQVWLAHDKLLDRKVAIKILHSGMSDKRLMQDFLREAQAAAKLNHPNTVTIHQIDKQSGQVFIAMEYVEAGSLSDELRDKGALPWREATQAIRDAAAGLQAAHERGLVHRDIKPSNLMRSAHGLVKVVDFGLARVRNADSEVTQTQTGTILGSPAYMSPEQCRGERADARSDLYSLICSYYQLLTRRTPFAAPEMTVAMYQHCHEPFPDVRATGFKVPDGILRILEKGSRKNPQERYQTAAELIADLDAVLHAPEVSHIFGNDAVLPKPKNATDGKPGLVGSILKGKGILGKTTWAVVALAVGWLSLVALRSRGPRPETPPAATPEPAPGAGDSRVVHAAALAAVNDAVAPKADLHLVQTYEGARTATGKSARTYVFLTANVRNIVQIGPDSGAAIWERASGRQILNESGPTAISPDRHYVAWADKDHARIVDVENPDQALVLDTSFTDRRCVSFSLDHTRLAVSTGSDLSVWNLSTAKRILREDRERDFVRYSPNGLHLLCWNEDSEPHQGLSLFDARILTRVWTNPESSVCFAAFSRDGTRIVTGDLSAVKVIDAASGNTLAKFGGPTAGIAEMEGHFSPDGNFILTFCHGALSDANKGGPVKVYNSETGRDIGWLPAPIPLAFAAEWSPNGKRILVGCDDGAMRLLDFETGKVLQVFTGHTGAVRAVTFSLNGKFVASCCDDNKVRLFSVAVP